MSRWILLVLVPVASATAQQWESSLASVASLRTGGASLVSSDSLSLNHGQYALITYWEARSDSDLDIYRCVDITDSSFEPISQECWKVLRPTGRAPRVAESVTATGDLCGDPGSDRVLNVIAFCAFSEPFVVRTPHFELTLAPFENGGQVAVRENGRYILVTDDELPASVVFEVRADSLAAYPELAGMASPEELIEQAPDAVQCRWTDVAGNQWVRCETTDFPFTIAHYLMTDGIVYSVSFDSDTSTADGQTLGVMFNSLSTGGGANDR